MSFNRKSGINNGTKEGADQLLIHSKSPGGKCNGEYSYLESKLNPGETYTVSDTNISIVFESMRGDGNYMFAQVVVKAVNSRVETCNDSPLRFRTVINGSSVLKSCEWAANRSTTMRCSLEGVASMCPKTCGTSTGNICSDATSRFQFEYNDSNILRDCGWVKNKDTLNRCEVLGMKDTCRETCSSV